MTERYTYAYDGAGRLVMDSRNGDTDLVTRYGYNVRSAVTEIKAGGTNASTYGATFTELSATCTLPIFGKFTNSIQSATSFCQ